MVYKKNVKYSTAHIVLAFIGCYGSKFCRRYPCPPLKMSMEIAINNKMSFNKWEWIKKEMLKEDKKTTVYIYAISGWSPARVAIS